jgi:probable rRNA maturation factor
MTMHIDIQHACNNETPEPDKVLKLWAETALQHNQVSGELTLRFVEPLEIQELNRTFRKQDKTTNVLAFPTELPDEVMLELPFLGDVIICPEVLAEESIRLEKPIKAHWAHIIIHGILHLLGYDHIEDKDAEEMQRLEAEVLQQLGFANPYNDEEYNSERG